MKQISKFGGPPPEGEGRLQWASGQLLSSGKLRI